MDTISGIYKITNTITGYFYIGSSKDVKKDGENINANLLGMSVQTIQCTMICRNMELISLFLKYLKKLK